MAADLREGVLLTDFRLEQVVARGAMGVVYRATQLSLDRQVAVKVVAPELADDDDFRERFLREGRAAAAIDHPHVLPVYTAGEVDGVLFLAMRLVEGESLADLLRREGRLDPERARSLTRQVADALEAAHAAGLVHRDVKPGNILLAQAGSSEHAYLCDFGIARHVTSDASLTRAGGFVGSAAYAAPEQIRGDPVDGRADVYALGCVLFECLVGRPPFVREHEVATMWAHVSEPPPIASEERPALGSEFDAVLRTVLAKDPAGRFASASEFVDALDARARGPRAQLPVSAARSTLPVPLSSFLGRERELEELVELLAERRARLLTLTGPGGIGKTRLAIEAARRTSGAFDDVFWVGLATIRDPGLVTATIARALGIEDGLSEHIGERELLLLVDNLEHVIEAAPELGTLLVACPGLTLLVTSRELLRVQGELEFPVPALVEPEAVSLFCERGRLERTDEIVELCARLDNLPLAVELAAARTRALSPSQILERLGSRLDLLRGGRDADPRQETLRATIEWSYGLLSPEEQLLFARLSVFTGGSTLDAAEAVAGADVDTLQSLVEKSLLRHTHERYWMLETIREFAAERLDGDCSRSAHARYFLGRAEALAPGLRGDDQKVALGTVEADLANYRAALVELETVGDHLALLRLATALSDFWWQRGHAREGFDWIRAALGVNPEPTRLRAEALRAATELGFDAGAPSTRALAEEAVALTRQLELDVPLARCLNNLGALEHAAGELDRAATLFGESAEIRRREGDLVGLARSLGNLGGVEIARGNLDRARAILEEVLELHEAPFDEAVGFTNLAELELASGNPGLALSHYATALEAFADLDALPSVVRVLVSIARVASRDGDSSTGARLLGAASSLEDRFDPLLDRDFSLEKAEAQEIVERTLERRALDAAWDEGHSLGLDAAVALALAYARRPDTMQPVGAGVSQPAGSVTLVFTDIEGSTRLLHELGTAGYKDALAEHRRIVREACARHSGYEVDYEGDAFFYAFATARDAVSAVSEAMALLGDGPIRIRVGIHTGEPEVDPPKYVGIDVHTAARIMSAGHGGQVLVSPTTAELLSASIDQSQALPAVSLVPLGEHRLKDLAEPVPLYQLGEGSFPPLKTISNTNLPRPASSFVGRERELAEVVAKIERGARLLTFTGPGGTGKTRLSIEAASSLVGDYDAGVFWVGLASLRDPELVTETISQVLGAKDSLAAHIGERELLLLLDNLEQVVECAPELGALLERCPHLTLLVTSRELLRISGEVEYAVPPLATQDAVDLFCARSALRPSPEITELCARLDSLPLAVELAAARTKALTPAQILERLSSRLDLLKGGRDADPRQQTLRATIEWSYDLLSPEEQQLFARLSVFAGGCTVEAAEQVAEADLDTLQSLVEKSLVRFTDARYWMLETVREYAAERLGPDQVLGGRHAEFVGQLVQRVNAELRGDHDDVLLDELAGEHDNLRAALTWCIAFDPRRGVQIAADSDRFMWMRGHVAETRAWLVALLERRDALTPELEALALALLAFAAGEQGDESQAVACGEAALRIARELGEDDVAYKALESLAGAYELLERDSDAEAAYDEAYSIAKRSGNRYREAASAYNAGAAAQSRGDLARARTLIEEALRLSREIGSQEGVASSLVGLGALLREEGRLAESLALQREALVETTRLGFPARSAVSMLEISAVFSLTDDLERAAWLLGAAEATFEAAAVEIDDLADEVATRLEAGLSEPEFERLRGEGSTATLEEAVERALVMTD